MSVDLSEWERHWAREGRAQLVALLADTWQPVYLFADSPLDFTTEAAAIGPVLLQEGKVKLEAFLWSREQLHDESDSPLTDAHHGELMAVANSIIQWYYEVRGQLWAFIAPTMDRAFGWLGDAGYQVHPAAQSPRGQTTRLSARSDAIEITASVVLGHGFGMHVNLAAPRRRKTSLATCLQAHGLSVPTAELPRRSAADYNAHMVRAIEQTADAMRSLLQAVPPDALLQPVIVDEAAEERRRVRAAQNEQIANAILDSVNARKVGDEKRADEMLRRIMDAAPRIWPDERR